MRGLKTLAALTLAALTAPAFADNHATGERDVIAGVEAFLAAQRTGDKRQLEATMMPKAKLSIERVGNVKGKRAEVIGTAKYIKRVTSFGDRVDEQMIYQSVSVSGDTAQVTGPFNFTVDGKTTHCGTNTLGMVKHEGRWKVGDSRYVIVPPSQCAAVGAPAVNG